MDFSLGVTLPVTERPIQPSAGNCLEIKLNSVIPTVERNLLQKFGSKLKFVIANLKCNLPLKMQRVPIKKSTCEIASVECILCFQFHTAVCFMFSVKNTGLNFFVEHY